MAGKSCFIIMPFSKTKTKSGDLNYHELEFIYTNVIKRAVEELRDDEKPFFSSVTRYDSKVGSIISGIVNTLNDADLVIADLTGLNHNVMYELGVRHTLKRGTIIVTQDIDTLPSDLRDYFFIPYEYAQSTLEQNDNYRRFRDKLHNAINELFSTKKHDSPVLAYLNNRQKFWAEDEIKRVKENMVVFLYIVEQYEEIKGLLLAVTKEKHELKLRSQFIKFFSLIDSLTQAMVDLNISIQHVGLYENIIAAKQLINDIQKKIQYTDYLSNYFNKFASDTQINFESLKFEIFNERFTDYFKLMNEGVYQQVSLMEIFNDENDFHIFFIEELESYLEKRALEMGISEDDIDFMQSN